jgi:hypothetical protein
VTSERDTPARASDTDFERWLLDSAQGDALPPAEPAFAKFTAALSLVALQGTTAPVAHAVGGTRRLALKWLATGAVAGSAVTALWLGLGRPPRPSAMPLEPAVRLVTAAPALEVPSGSASALELRPLADPHPVRREPRPRASAMKGAASNALPTPAAPTASGAQSTLLAEVALLDAVRAKLSLNDTAGALHLLESYQRQFPRGQLASDAAALSIEALAAAGNRAEVQRRAATFLERSPGDPHAARVRSLAGQ